MKTNILFFISIFVLISCNQQRYRNEYIESDSVAVVTEIDEDVIETTPKEYYNICNLSDSIRMLYPNIGKNDIQTENACTHAFMEFTTKFNYYVYNIKFQLTDMMRYNSKKYILKFETGKYTTKDDQLIDKGVSICVFGYVNLDVAERIIKGEKYYISGKNIIPYLDLPNGCRYTMNVTEFDKCLYFSCVVKDIKVCNI